MFTCASNSNICAVKADGGQLIRLTSKPPCKPAEATDDAAWSPDGDWIAFSCGTTGVFVMRSDGSSIRRIAPEGLFPAWRPISR